MRDVTNQKYLLAVILPKVEFQGVGFQQTSLVGAFKMHIMTSTLLWSRAMGDHCFISAASPPGSSRMCSTVKVQSDEEQTTYISPFSAPLIE